MFLEQNIVYEEELQKLNREDEKWKDSELLSCAPLIHTIILLFLINHPKASTEEANCKGLDEWAAESPGRCQTARELFSRTTLVKTTIKKWSGADFGVEVQMSFYETHATWPILLMSGWIKIEEGIFTEKITSSLD